MIFTQWRSFLFRVVFCQQVNCPFGMRHEITSVSHKRPTDWTGPTSFCSCRCPCSNRIYNNSNNKRPSPKDPPSISALFTNDNPKCCCRCCSFLAWKTIDLSSFSLQSFQLISPFFLCSPWQQRTPVTSDDGCSWCCWQLSWITERKDWKKKKDFFLCFLSIVICCCLLLLRHFNLLPNASNNDFDYYSTFLLQFGTSERYIRETSSHFCVCLLLVSELNSLNCKLSALHPSARSCFLPSSCYYDAAHGGVINFYPL